MYLQPVEMAEAIRSACLGLERECPVVDLRIPRAESPYLHSPRLLGGPRIAELRQRNSHLCVPAEWIDGGRSFIDRIPRRIGILLARAEGVISNSRRIDLESRA